MDFESPDVEKDFPGLYASESGRKSNESDFSDGGDHDKPSKKDLLGRRKEKKEKKDRGYAALAGESSPEEDTDTKSPSKSKKTKSFKFPTKSKEKREKSRDKERVLEDVSKQKDLNEKEKKKREREKEREREKKEKEKREKLKEKDKEKEEKAKFKLESKEKLKDEKKDKTKDKEKEKIKDKDKEKVKDKDKDKKDKKLTKVPSTVTSGVPFEEIFTLGVALPIFGVPLQQSVERSRCHDDSLLPLLIREGIDYLQANGLKSPQIYRTEPDRIKLQQLRKLFTDRAPTFPYHWDVPVACAMLKEFISALPECILTEALVSQCEHAAAIAEPQRESAICLLVRKLPPAHYSLVGWLMRHFDSVVGNEQVNLANIQTIMTYMGPTLNMSLNLFTYLVTKSEKIFPDIQLTKYIPPLATLPADFPPDASAIVCELRKQESLLSQIHAEMHAGFITPARDQRLWEAQRILTQLKRMLRSVQKSCDPNSMNQQLSLDDKQENDMSRRGSHNDQPTSHTEELKSPNDTTQDKESPKTDSFEPDFAKADAFEPDFAKAEAFEPDFAKAEAPFAVEPAFEPKFANEPAFETKFEEPAFEPKFANEGAFEAKFAKTETVFEPKFGKTETAFEPSFVNAPEFPVQENFETKFAKLPESSFDEPAFEPNFEADFEDNFEFKDKITPDKDIPPAEPVKEKPKFTEKELRILRLELENAEYLQLKSLLQAKINSEQFEIVKLRSHVALKNKQESLQNWDNKENITEDPELKQRLIKENAALEQKRQNLINQIYQERVACIQLKIELAMKEILSKS